MILLSSISLLNIIDITPQYIDTTPLKSSNQAGHFTMTFCAYTLISLLNILNMMVMINLWWQRAGWPLHCDILRLCSTATWGRSLAPPRSPGGGGRDDDDADQDDGGDGDQDDDDGEGDDAWLHLDHL